MIPYAHENAMHLYRALRYQIPLRKRAEPVPLSMAPQSPAPASENLSKFSFDFIETKSLSHPKPITASPRLGAPHKTSNFDKRPCSSLVPPSNKRPPRSVSTPIRFHRPWDGEPVSVCLVAKADGCTKYIQAPDICLESALQGTSDRKI